MTYYVYILECADKTYYVGVTNDLDKRLADHNGTAAGAKYTRGRRPVKLIFQEAWPTKSEALKREAEIKNWRKEDKATLVESPTLPEYLVRVNRRAKHLRITVYPDGKVIVTTPRVVSETKIRQFVVEKQDWIRKQLAETKAVRPDNYDEKKSYSVYKDAALRLVERRIAYFNQYYDFDFSGIRITNTKSQWGSCSAKRVLSFNFRIAFLKPSLADYLIVHELCHLREFNHSARFWALVERAIPDYKAVRKELKQEGLVLY